MIDWFVLLTPLFLLPIFLLFVFVGCGAEFKDGGLSPVKFIYEKNLPMTDLIVKWGGNFASTLNEINLHTPFGIKPEGEEITVGTIPLSSKGKVECHCTITVGGSDKPIPADPGEKIEHEDAPKFVLKTIAGGFFISTE